MSTSRMLANMEPGINRLPPEVINQIFSSLSFNDSKHVRQVMKQWKDIFDHLSFRDQQQIFFKLFNVKIDISVHKNFSDFLKSLNKLSSTNIDQIIDIHRGKQKNLAKKRINSKLRYMCCSLQTFHCCSKEGSKEAQEAELQAVEKGCFAFPFILSGMTLGFLLFILSISFHIDSTSDPLIFVLLGGLSIFVFALLCGASAVLITNALVEHYPKSVETRTTLASRQFFNLLNQEKDNGADTIIDIPHLLRNSYEHESHAGQNGYRN